MSVDPLSRFHDYSNQEFAEAIQRNRFTDNGFRDLGTLAHGYEDGRHPDDGVTLYGRGEPLPRLVREADARHRTENPLGDEEPPRYTEVLGSHDQAWFGSFGGGREPAAGSKFSDHPLAGLPERFGKEPGGGRGDAGVEEGDIIGEVVGEDGGEEGDVGAVLAGDEEEGDDGWPICGPPPEWDFQAILDWFMYEDLDSSAEEQEQEEGAAGASPRAKWGPGTGKRHPGFNPYPTEQEFNRFPLPSEAQLRQLPRWDGHRHDGADGWFDTVSELSRFMDHVKQGGWGGWACGFTGKEGGGVGEGGGEELCGLERGGGEWRRGEWWGGEWSSGEGGSGGERRERT